MVFTIPINFDYVSFPFIVGWNIDDGILQEVHADGE
jgi:hypothetical protein